MAPWHWNACLNYCQDIMSFHRMSMFYVYCLFRKISPSHRIFLIGRFNEFRKLDDSSAVTILLAGTKTGNIYVLISGYLMCARLSVADLVNRPGEIVNMVLASDLKTFSCIIKDDSSSRYFFGMWLSGRYFWEITVFWQKLLLRWTGSRWKNFFSETRISSEKLMENLINP